MAESGCGANAPRAAPDWKVAIASSGRLRWCEGGRFLLLCVWEMCACRSWARAGGRPRRRCDRAFAGPDPKRGRKAGRGSARRRRTNYSADILHVCEQEKERGYFRLWCPGCGGMSWLFDPCALLGARLRGHLHLLSPLPVGRSGLGGLRAMAGTGWLQGVWWFWSGLRVVVSCQPGCCAAGGRKARVQVPGHGYTSPRRASARQALGARRQEKERARGDAGGAFLLPLAALRPESLPGAKVHPGR